MFGKYSNSTWEKLINFGIAKVDCCADSWNKQRNASFNCSVSSLLVSYEKPPPSIRLNEFYWMNSIGGWEFLHSTGYNVQAQLGGRMHYDQCLVDKSMLD